GLNQEILAAASTVGINLQQAVVSQFGSDASIAMKFGHVPRGACLSFPTQNTHGYEIAHLDAIANCLTVLTTYLSDSIGPTG
ncbi:MAG: M42 family peptidase, partial [Cyanobacteria bacterium J06626_26]